MTVEDNNDGNKQLHRESMMGHGLVGLVESVGLGELVLMVDQAQLLARIKNGVLELVFFGRVPELDIHVLFFLLGDIILVLEVGKRPLAADLPSQKCVMRHEDHMVGINGPERSQTITHDGEKCDQNVVDDVNDVKLPSADIDPAWRRKSARSPI